MRSSERRQNEEQPIKRILAMMLDEGGVCRAWATGPTTEVEDVKQLAKQQLATYIEEKKQFNDPLAYHDYTMEVRLDNGEKVWETVEKELIKDVS